MDVRIIGQGNVLMGDDGVGPFVARVLESQYLFPPDVTVIDAGMPGADLPAFLIDADVAIMVDAIDCGEAGTVKTCDHCAVLDTPALQCPRLRREVRDVLLALDAIRRAPRAVVLVAVPPQWIATGPHLSDAVRKASALAVDRIVGELEHLGLRPRPNPAPWEPDIWWQPSAV